MHQDLPLLGPDDPAPVSIVNPGGLAPVLLICDHASNAVPAALRGLSLVVLQFAFVVVDMIGVWHWLIV